MENRLYLRAYPLPLPVSSPTALPPAIAGAGHGRIAGAWHERIAGAIRRALPQACALCAARAGTELVCDACAVSLTRLGSGCPRCALPLASGERCARCLSDPPSYDSTLAAYVYEFPLDRLIQSYKYNGALSLAGWFAERMAEMAGAGSPTADLMVAMPLSRKRQRVRGFNHAQEIARNLARRGGMPLASALVTRVRDTPAQATLPWSDRATNVRGAFACDDSVAGKSVVIVDDVMTTGASLGELARILKQAGATRVDTWLIARTLPPDRPLTPFVPFVPFVPVVPLAPFAPFVPFVPLAR